jgi:hypothetical protein
VLSAAPQSADSPKPTGRYQVFATSGRPAPHAGMNTQDSAATSMNKINAPLPAVW